MRTMAAIVVMFVLSLSGTLKAQNTTASVTGQIMDASKGVIADANVTLTNPSTNISYRGKTNVSGSYYVTDLPVGSYRLEVEKPGFQTVVKPDIVLHVQDVVEINFEMAVGSSAESITVQGGAIPLELSSSTIDDVIDSTTVR